MESVLIIATLYGPSRATKHDSRVTETSGVRIFCVEAAIYYRSASSLSRPILRPTLLTFSLHSQGRIHGFFEGEVFFSLFKENFIVPRNYTRSTEDKGVARGVSRLPGPAPPPSKNIRNFTPPPKPTPGRNFRLLGPPPPTQLCL